MLFRSTSTCAETVREQDNIPDAANVPPNPWETTVANGDALAFSGHAGGYGLYYSVPDSVLNFNVSKLYRAEDPNVGEVPQQVPYGFIGNITGPGVGGRTTGMAFVGPTLYGVSTAGQFFRISTGSGAATLIKQFPTYNFTGLALGPQNLNEGAFARTLFATTTTGRVVAFSITGQDVLAFDTNGDDVGDSPFMLTTITNPTGLAFSPLDINLDRKSTRLNSSH